MNTDTLNIVFGIIGTIGTILGIVGIVLSIRSVKKKEPIYSIKSNNLISGSIATVENMKIDYKDYKGDDLTVSKLLFYNAGSETITRQDLETINRLRVSSETCKILDGSVLQVNNVSNNISLRFDPDSTNIFMDFDYLDFNHGTVLQVVHSGLSSKDINISGDIRGVQQIAQLDPNQMIDEPVHTYTLIMLIIFFVFLMGAVSGVYVLIYHRDNILSSLKSGNLIWIILSCIILPVVLVATMMTLFGGHEILEGIRRPKRTIPPGLEKFAE